MTGRNGEMKMEENLNNGQALVPVTMTMDDNSKFIVDLTAPKTLTFCSMKADTPKAKASLFKAMNNPEKRIADCINEVINAKDLFCEVVQCTNKETGEITPCPRVVIIDDKGIGYQAVSLGVFSAFKKLIAVYGSPTWATPLKLKVKQITKGDRKLLTFDVVE
jgi:hypothetical protein